MTAGAQPVWVGSGCGTIWKKAGSLVKGYWAQELLSRSSTLVFKECWTSVAALQTEAW